MPKKRFSDEQIAFALRQAESGTTIRVCRKMGIAKATFYRWKKVYAGMWTRGPAMINCFAI